MTVRPQARRRLAAFGVLCALVLVCWRSWAQPPRLPEPSKPEPDFANIRYGPHERNVLDLWKAKPKSKQSAGKAIGQRNDWLVRNASGALAVWDGTNDRTLGAMVRSLEQRIPDDVWIIAPDAG